MTLHERYPDILAEHDDPDMVRLVNELDRICAGSQLPASRRAAILDMLRCQAYAEGLRSRLSTRLWRR